MWSPLLILTLIACCLRAATDWPEFRGPHGDGTSDTHELPIHWNEKENIRWKTTLPGEGWSTPVIGEGRVWLTTSLQEGHSLRALCVNAVTGKIIHDVEVFSNKNPEPINNHGNTHASPSPVLAQNRVFVSYGRHGSACLDATTGKVLWRNQELEVSHDNNGAGSSPIVVSNSMILPCDGLHQPFIAALHCDTGQIVWKTWRSKSAGVNKAFSTPVLVRVDGQERLLSAGSRRISGYDPMSGRELWAVDLPGNSIVPRPLVHDGLVFVCTGFPKPELWAIKLSGQGVVKEDEAVAWKYKKQVPQVPSPIVLQDRLFMISDDGMLTCLDAKNGRELYAERLNASFFASPVAASGHIYLTSKDGISFVFSGSNKFEMLATNVLSEGCFASPAISGRTIFLRTSGHLYKIEE